MAIFGKKKEKEKGAAGSKDGTEGSPILDQQGGSASGSASGHNNPSAAPPLGSGNAGGGPPSSTRGPPSNGSLSQHGPKSSLGQQQQGGIGGQQQSPQSAMNGFSGSGPNPSSSGFGGPNSAPGSASGFKFGGNGGNASNGPPPSGKQNGPGPGSGMPMQQQQVGGGMGNGPPPSSNNQQQSGPRSRKISEDSSGSHAGYGIAGNGLPPSSGNGLPISGGPGGGAPSSDGPSNVGGGGSSTGSSSTRPRTQQIVYPWSSRPLSLMPPRFLDETRQAPPGALSPSPFPRYGHAANSMASTNAEVYLFGGLVRESVKNDLYIINVSGVVSSSTTTSPTTSANSPPSNIINNGGVNATLVQTTGEIPPPRVGHAVVLVSNVLILWGGDTKVRADDRQDESLYLLNLSSREWTRVRSQASDSGAPNAGPVGRYGHSVSIVGSRFYVFGGQTEGMFLNDLWSFDLNSLKGTPTWEVIRPSTTDLPPRRTGHASVTYKDKIFVFGGTDGQYHYNDTWCFDVTTNSWKELSCIGYIPVPREGHAVTLVDDVMYIFGGRGVDGKELGDLASFKISNQRWYMFANMGPSPSPRSGHALTTHQNKVLVLGGENFTAGNKPDDPTVVSVLDTAKIKYPPDNGSKTPSTRKSNVPGASTAGSTQAGSRSMSPVSEEQARRAASPTQRGMNQPTNGLVGMMQNGSSQQQQQQQGSSLQQSGPSSSSTIPRAPGSTIAGGVEPPARAMSPTQQTVAQQRAAVLQGAGPAPNGIPNSSSNGQASISSVQAQAQAQRAVSPPTGASGMTYTGPRSQRSLENLRAGATSPPGPPGAMPRGINGTMERGASPASSIPAPGDAFHYGRNGSPPTTTGVNGYSKSNLAPSAELEAMRKRETWMKTALAMAQKQGFVTPEQLSLPDGTNMVSKDLPELSLEDIDTGAVGADKERIIRALVTLKSQLATAKSAMAQQAQAEVERIAEADRARSAALQEAAFCRAKVAALESNNPSEASRIERERTIQVERQMANTLRDNTELERQISTLKEQTRLEQSLRASAEDRLSDTAKRAMAAEAAQMKAYDELSALQKRSYNHESSLREHQEKVTTLSSLAARHKSDHESARSQLDGANQAVDKHLMALTQLQAGLAAATARASEHERLHFQHRDLASQHQETIVRLRNDLGARTVEAETQSKRVKDLEALVNHHRNEAEAHRSAASGSLAQLLQHNQQKIASRSAGTDGDIPSHVSDKISALETEAESLRALHSESRSLADSSTSQLQEMREKNNSLEKQHSGLRSELAAMRSQLAIALQEVARMKDLGSSKDIQLRDSTRAIEAAQIKSSLLRQFMSERGLEVPGDEELSERGGFADKRIRKLEEEIDSKTKEVQDAEHKLQESDSKVEELTRELEHKVSSMGAVGSRALGGSDSADLAAAQRRANNAERELSEATASYKERMAQLENDYQTAVQFVKGTEKMLRRMKDELTKYKTENATLQSEISSLRSGSASGANQKSRDEEASEAARDIEALRNRLVDVTQQSEEAAIENRELERRLASLITEQKEARDKSRGLEDSNTDSNKKIDEMENEINRLQDTLNNVRKELQETLRLNQHLSNELSNASKSGGGGVSGSDLNRDLNAAQSQSQQLKNENASLSQRLQETEDKVQLLLGRMESNHGDEPVRESMGYGSITSELDKWERDRNFETDPYSIGERSASPVGANGSGLQ